MGPGRTVPQRPLGQIPVRAGVSGQLAPWGIADPMDFLTRWLTRLCFSLLWSFISSLVRLALGTCASEVFSMHRLPSFFL